MSDCYGRENRSPNRWGCKPSEDVCMCHHAPLVCPHGCEEVGEHSCAELARYFASTSSTGIALADLPAWAREKYGKRK